jgi:beta-barrel assembly-enhancing protease
MERLMRSHVLPPLLGALAISACVAPTSRLDRISPELVRAEQLKQQQLVIRSGMMEQQRLADVAFPMMRAATPLCGQWITTTSGVRVSNIHDYPRDFHEAARSLGFSDTLMVVGVPAGSSAERAGFVVGDRVVGVAGARAPVGRRAASDLAVRIAPRPERRGAPALAAGPLHFVVHRAEESPAAGREVAIRVAPDTVCAYGSAAVKDDQLNAWADGRRVVVTTAMLRFAGTDDELAVVVAHEIAHNAMRHMDAKQRNATVGALFGALLDIAAATQGVNTGGDFTNSGAAIGALTYSQDFEREADYVGMYILARSGRPIDLAANFWRRMAQESPGSIKYASSHPTTAERFVRLEQAAEEIRRKQEAGEALLPTQKDAKAP